MLMLARGRRRCIGSGSSFCRCLKLDEDLLKFKQHNPIANCLTYDFAPVHAPCLIESIRVDIGSISKNSSIVEIGSWKTELLNCDYFGCMTTRNKVGSSKAILLVFDTQAKCLDLVKFEFSQVAI
jgi:hypothetical protein